MAAVDFVRRIVVLESTGSTNDDARRLAAEGAPEGTVVLAERQTAGRGRLGRAWDSPDHLGLYMSVLLRPQEAPDRIGRYAIACAVAVCAACRELAGPEIVLKWPNDVLASGRKLAGILSELRQAREDVDLVVGIGLNVDQAEGDFPTALAGRATSLRLVRGGPGASREAVVEALLRELGATIARLRTGGWAEVAERFLRYAPDAAGRRVRLVSGEAGVTDGLHESGALAVKTARGVVLAHASESVTLI